MKRSIPILAPLSCLLLLTSLSGCGLILGGGSRQTIQLQASPTGTKVTTTPSTGDYTTPTTLDLSRKIDYTLRFEKEGYAPATMQIESHVRGGYVVADVLLTGLVGVIVDAATGGWSKLSPESASVTLTKVALVPGPDSITVGLTMRRTRNQDHIAVTSTAPGVSLHVTPAER